MTIQAGISCQSQSNRSALIAWILDTPCAAVIFYNEPGRVDDNVRKAVGRREGGKEDTLDSQRRFLSVYEITNIRDCRQVKVIETSVISSSLFCSLRFYFLVVAGSFPSVPKGSASQMNGKGNITIVYASSNAVW
nr:hypothetical protein B9J10.160 [imported] - Neurospora crassa [Neurospora crassa]